MPEPTHHERVVAFPIHIPNPLSWLGDQAGKAIADVWKAAMTGLWSAALWLLQLAFKVIDAFTTPDLSAGGPIAPVLPMILWIAVSVVGTMFLVQLTLVLVRRDGKTLGQLLLGTVQFGAVWLGYLGIASAAVTAASGLARGILRAMLHVDGFSALDLSRSMPRAISDATVATVLGVVGLLLLIPAAFLYLIVMFVREAAIIILAATAPISAAGLVSDVGKMWFWKTLRWFIAALLIAPAAALIIGLGVRLSQGVIDGHGDKTVAAVGMAVVSALMILIGALCPLVLFKLLAFVEPHTASGAALRQSWEDSGGLSGLLSVRGGVGSAVAGSSGPDGRSHGETTAESAGMGRLARLMSPVGEGIGAVMRVSGRAADLAADVLGAAGVGHPSYAMGMADYQAGRRRSGAAGQHIAGTTAPADGPGGEAPTPPPPPTSPDPPPGSGTTGPLPGGGTPNVPPGGGGAGAGPAEAGAVPEVPA
jgi:type IV secretion system protein TrbL